MMRAAVFDQLLIARQQPGAQSPCRGDHDPICGIALELSRQPAAVQRDFRRKRNQRQSRGFQRSATTSIRRCHPRFSKASGASVESSPRHPRSVVVDRGKQEAWPARESRHVPAERFTLAQCCVRVGSRHLNQSRPAETGQTAGRSHCRPDTKRFSCAPDHAPAPLATRALPPRHADPFDRLLVAQAQCEDLTIVTADVLISAYNVRTIDASA